MKKGNIMNRSIKFKLKNGKVVTIRRVRGTDYDAIMKFFDKFSRGIGAFQTCQYAGQPKKDKARSIEAYANKNSLYIAAWDGDNVVSVSSIDKIRPNHPYYMGKSASIGISMLDKYTHNGIGNKMLQILEKWARENGVHKIECEIRHENIASIANCIKNGFVITGIHYDAVFINNKWINEYILEKIL